MWNFIGNERVVAALGRALETGAAAHAYLFAGPERVGKRTLALQLAQVLNCTGGATGSSDAVTAGAVTYGCVSEPCGSCTPCRRIAAGLHADVQVITVEPSDEGPAHKAISVAQVREVERAVALNPFEGRTRVVIFDPADAMNGEAQNAFLKTLEEPPPHVVFVLVTARHERLLPTIRSRCRRLEFRLLPVTAVEEALRSAGVEAEKARLLARVSRGAIGWALEAAQDPSLLERRREMLRVASSLAGMSIAERMALAERLALDFRRDREGVLAQLSLWQSWWRDVLRAQSGAEDGVANVDMAPELRQDASRYHVREVAAFVRALGATQRHLEENVQPRLALEALLLEAPSVSVAPARA